MTGITKKNLMRSNCPLAKNVLACSALLAFQPQLAVGNELSNEGLALATDLQISLTPGNSSYEKSENISFHFRSNQDVYLYLYTTNSDGSHNLILPNTLQTDNQYTANKDHLIPDQRVRFQADGSTSVEDVVLVASTDRLEKHTAMQKKGDFYSITDEELQRAFASKRFKIRDTETIPPAAQQQVPEAMQENLVLSVFLQLKIKIRDALAH